MQTERIIDSPVSQIPSAPHLSWMITTATGTALWIGVLWVAIRAFLHKRAGVLLPFWVFAAGMAAPYIPPTIRQFLMSCPPPAISCGVVGSAPWPILAACFCGFAISAYASWHNSGAEEQLASKPFAKGMKFFSAILALASGVTFIWLYYDIHTLEIKEAISNAVAAERIRAAGKVWVTDIVGGPSVSLTAFIGLIATLTIGAASFQGPMRLLTCLWIFVFGLIFSSVVAAADSIGSFGWPYRDFAEKYAWFFLFALCCSGLLAVRLAERNLRVVPSAVR